MKHLFLIPASIVLLYLSCGFVKTTPTMNTFEQLGDSVFNAIANNDWNAFERFLASPEDYVQIKDGT